MNVKEIPILFSTPMVQAILEERKTMTRRTKGLEKINENPDIWSFQEVFTHVGKLEREKYIFRFTDSQGGFMDIPCPFGKPSDLLFVRESWKLVGGDFEDGKARIQYADGAEYSFPTPDDYDYKGYNWLIRQFEKLLAKDIIMPESDSDECPMIFTGEKHPFSPSIHLPKWCSRIWLEVTDVRVERLHDISEDDAKAEGVEQNPDGSWRDYLEPIRLWQDAAKPSFISLWQSINGEDSWNANPWVWVVSFEVLSTTGKPIKL